MVYTNSRTLNLESKNRPHTLKENVRVLDQHVKIQEAKVMDIT